MTHSAGGGGSFSRWLNVKSCFLFFLYWTWSTCMRTHTHVHTHTHTARLVGLPTNQRLLHLIPLSTFLFTFLSVCRLFLFFAPFLPHSWVLLPLFHLFIFCPSVKSSHYVSLPPRRRETTTASVGNYRSTALLRTRPGLSTRQTAMCL